MRGLAFFRRLAAIIPDSKIQRRLLGRVLPLVTVPLLFVGMILWLFIAKSTSNQSDTFLHEREQDLITLSENSALSDYILYTEFELREEADTYRREFENYIRNFMARRNTADPPILTEIVFADQIGIERIKINFDGSPKVYRNVRNVPFFQEARGQTNAYGSPIQEEMVYSRAVFRDHAREKFRGVIIVRFLYPLAQFSRRRTTGAILPPIVLFVSLVIAIWVTTSQVQRIVQPLRQLVEVSDSIAGGDLHVKIEVNTGDEVEQLARSFNFMATSLEELLQKTLESEREYRNLFERSKDGIFICDLRGALVAINEAGLEMMGYGGKDDLPGLESAQDLHFTTQDWQLFEREMRDRGFVKDFELQLKRKSGVELDVLITGSLQRDGQRHILGYEGVIRDITEKKRLEKELIQSHKMAAISKLVAGVSHELNTPLAAMLSNLRVCARYHEQLSKLVESVDQQALAQNGNGAEAIRKMQPLLGSVLGILEETKDAGNKAGGIIASLKKIYHSGSGESVVNLINLNDEIQSVISLYRQTKEKIKFRCLFSMLPSIPCHNNELTQVFINIINNGIHAMNEAGEITIQTGEAGDCVRVTITDEGKGIPPEVLPKIFDPFYTTKKIGEGLGIGLSIVWSIVEKHKGHIQVSSELGRGTTFTIDLPKASR